MLFPDTMQYANEAHRSLIKMMERSYMSGIQQNQIYWSESSIDARFEAGDQSVWNEIYQLTQAQRKQFNFNRIRRIVNMISGHQRLNRKAISVVPIENSDQITADQFTKIFYWLNSQEGVLETISDAFHGSLVTGMNLLQVWVDYRNDPISGSIKVDKCDYNSFMIDPYFRKQDLSDCNYIWKRTYLTPAECISLLPDKESEISSMSPEGQTRDGKFAFMPENYQIDVKGLFAYDEYYYRAYRRQKLLVDTQTGETLEWMARDNNTLRQFISMYPQVDVIDAVIPTVKLAILVHGKVMYDDINPLGIDTYPFVPVFAYYNPQIAMYSLRLQGVVRGLRDAQFLYNRRKAIELDTLESQVNSGWIYKEDALVNPKDVFQSGQGRGIALKSTAQMTDVQRIESPAIPPTTIELSRALGAEIEQISGVNEELLGAATDDKAGVLSMLRQGAGLVTLQGLFDRLDYSQKLLGKIIIRVIQNNFTPGKVRRIIEEEPSQQFYNKFFGSYDCEVASAVLTENQKQLALVQGLHLREVGIPIPDEFLVENMVIQNKTQIIEQMKQQQQQAQEQQQQASQLQMQELQANIALAQSKVQEQQALANERNTRSASNLALSEERRMEAIKDLEQAKLEKLKQMAELENLDLSQLEKLIMLVKAVNEPITQEIVQEAQKSTNLPKAEMAPQGQQPSS